MLLWTCPTCAGWRKIWTASFCRRRQASVQAMARQQRCLQGVRGGPQLFGSHSKLLRGANTCVGPTVPTMGPKQWAKRDTGNNFLTHHGVRLLRRPRHLDCSGGRDTLARGRRFFLHTLARGRTLRFFTMARGRTLRFLFRARGRTPDALPAHRAWSAKRRSRHCGKLEKNEKALLEKNENGQC